MKYISIIFVLVLSVLLGVGCSKKEKVKENAEEANSVASTQNVSEIDNVQLREGIVPNFSFTDANGQTTNFDSFKGKVTLVNFWATWCGPCKVELPDLIALSKEYSDRNVRFIGISTDRGSDVVEDVRTFVQKSGITYQIVISNDDIESAYGNIHAIPTTFIVDENGKIVESFVGVRSKEYFAQALNKALGISS
ncbi:MAG: TlpA family protein disulfide reductase [Ignavibacteriales bacterium]|nr:TlpA family protein disulfide reductase [Ignavibacteriales bacterium]